MRALCDKARNASFPATERESVAKIELSSSASASSSSGSPSQVASFAPPFSPAASAASVEP